MWSQSQRVVGGEGVAMARANASETRTGGRCSVDTINTHKDSAKLQIRHPNFQEVLQPGPGAEEEV